MALYSTEYALTAALYSTEYALTAVGPDGDTVAHATHYATKNFNSQGNKFERK